jgi:hypothetical protein
LTRAVAERPIDGTEDLMAPKERTPDDPEAERRLAVELFNHVWTLLDKAERTSAEDDEMIHAAHASVYHWSVVGEPVNRARGEWQCSRVYAVLGRPEPALAHAQRCHEICEEHGIGDFDIAYAHEALARAHAAAGNREEAAWHRERAWEAAQDVREDDDRELLRRDLATL